MSTEHVDNTMLGRILKKGNFGLWLTGQMAALLIGIGLSIQHDWTLGLAAGFAIMVLVDIRGQLG